MKNVVREYINELFQQDSDPISDMNIGGIVLRHEFEKKYKQFKDEWRQYLRNVMGSIEGRKIKGEFQKNITDAPYQTYTFIVKECSFYFKDKDYIKKETDKITISPAIIFTSEEDNSYYNDGNHKFYIVE